MTDNVFKTALETVPMLALFCFETPKRILLFVLGYALLAIIAYWIFREWWALFVPLVVLFIPTYLCALNCADLDRRTAREQHQVTEKEDKAA